MADVPHNRAEGRQGGAMTLAPLCFMYIYDIGAVRKDGSFTNGIDPRGDSPHAHGRAHP